ncbi:hypothetical protein [Streptomyces sp. SID3343]|uniref:hypothetical protein n=1 Tax=Streptomyces sp. SID3343 TaxID=2690260 RepID=UPI00137199D2|nr:hypothetical protein [Streptomyces sp. SID3343]MYV99358.1 hypothetical protein [Streptomyces sp. SID3343]
MTRKPFGAASRLPVLASALIAGVLTCGVLAAPASAVQDAGAPTGLRMNPTPKNGTADSCGYIGRVNPTVGTVDLYATVESPSGANVGARFELTDVTAGNAVVWDSGWVSVASNRHEAQAFVPGSTFVDGKTYAWNARAGVATDPGQDVAAGCTFTVDATAPSVPTVSSSDFPVNGGGKYAGQSGVFEFSAADAGSGVAAVEYSLNGTIPVGGAHEATYDAVSGTWKTPPVRVGLWGSNRIFAQTRDKAGNVSQQATYTFYVPDDPSPQLPQPGDIDGNRRVDVLVTGSDGALRMYDQGDDPAGAGRLASLASEGRRLPGSELRSWAGLLVSHRNANQYDDDNLYTISGDMMTKYRNARGGMGDLEDGYFLGQDTMMVYRPYQCADPGNTNQACVDFADDWSQVRQLVATGEATGDTRHDLLTVEVDGSGNGRLILFTATSNSFSRATVIGSTGWGNRDVMSPGDVTGDGLADVWTRDRATGDIYQYASARNADGTVDVAALGRDQNRTLIGTGFDTAAYPKVSTEGDFDGDGKADVWAQAAGGNVYTFPGTDGTAFGPAQLIAGS